MRCVIVASTGGAVMNELLRNSFFKSQIAAVISDRDCGAVDKAAAHGVPTVILREPRKADFSDALLRYLTDNNIDYVISFFTKLFVGRLVDDFRDRIINLHPSLLPSFKGLDGFGDTLRYGTRYIGTTIHFIDSALDEGKIIQQTVWPVDPNSAESALRHRIFQQQCKSLLQVIHWLADDRIRVEGQRVVILNVRFDDLEYVPALDSSDAQALTIPIL